MFCITPKAFDPIEVVFVPAVYQRIGMIDGMRVAIAF
jgi:hypothetical protein